MKKQLLVILGLVAATTLADFTSNCPQECKCQWASGNKHADCSYANLENIIGNLSPEIQNLDLTGNNIIEITSEAFEEAGLINLKKLILRECKLKTIQRNAFSGLAITIELDLSKNDLKTLHSDTFRDTIKIRLMLLNDNQLEKLEDGLFSNLKYLQKINLSNNKIYQIGVETFKNLPKLTILRLDGNRLEHLYTETLNDLTSLWNLDIHDNPWRCDCRLQPFRNWVISKNFNTSPISCVTPHKVYGKLWKDLLDSDFACKPSIIQPSASTTIQTSDVNTTLSCEATGNPLPEISWFYKAQSIDGSHRHYISQVDMESIRIVNLTIIDVNTIDNGEYLCIAANLGGIVTRSVTLEVIKSNAQDTDSSSDINKGQITQRAWHGETSKSRGNRVLLACEFV